MTAKISFDADREGAVVTRLVTVDKTVVVPETIDGMPVHAIGPGFLAESRGGSGRTLIIPACVTRIDPAALDGTMGISTIEYGGELETFESFKLVNSNDCVLSCRNHGKDYRFGFMAYHPMSFPEFDDAVLSLCMRLTPEIALERLAEPVGLTAENRARYERFISDRIMPRAEKAVSSGDGSVLEELFAAGMLDDEALRILLERSVRSGRIAMTSAIMSMIRKNTVDSGNRGRGTFQARRPSPMRDPPRCPPCRGCRPPGRLRDPPGRRTSEPCGTASASDRTDPEGSPPLRPAARRTVY